MLKMPFFLTNIFLIYLQKMFFCAWREDCCQLCPLEIVAGAINTCFWAFFFSNVDFFDIPLLMSGLNVVVWSKIKVISLHHF